MEFFSFLRRRRAARAGAKSAQLPEGVKVAREGVKVAREGVKVAREGVKVAPAALPGPPLRISLPLPPDQVRRLVFDAVAAGDEAKLDALCREHRAVIVENREGWEEVPAEFRSSAGISQWYAQGLAAIARYCAERVLDTGVREEAADGQGLAEDAVADSQ